MAIIVDPDVLDRFDVVFNTASQVISIYPVGATQRGTTYTDVFVASTGTITTAGGNFNTDSVAAGDVVAIQNNVDGGHYYVDTAPAASTATLVEIDTGTGGAATTGLTVQQTTFDGADVNTGTEAIAIASHGYVTGDAVVLRGTTLPTSTPQVTTNTVYYVVRVDAGNIQLATTYANAVAGTVIDFTVQGAGTGHTLDDRLLVGIFTNGANTSEAILGNDTSGDGLGTVADGVTLQAVYSYAKEEWRVDSLETDLTTNYADDLIRHEFPFEAITSEQFEIGGGTSHDNWNWFNSYTRKKVRTAGWAEKTRTGTGDLARETGVITLGSLDADAQVYYQQTSVITAKADFTFLGPVNEALRIYTDASADNTPEDDFTTFLKLFVRKKGRTYAGSTIADIGVTTIQTIVNRFPLSHVVDAAITITDAQILGTNLYRFATTPVDILVTGTQIDGDTQAVNSTTFEALSAGFQADGVVPGDILHITGGTAAVQGYYEITAVPTATTLTIREAESVSGNDFTFNTGFQADETSLAFAVYSSILVPAPGDTTIRDSGTLTDETATSIVDAGGGQGTLTDSGRNFTTDGVASGDILEITNFYDLDFNANTEVDAVTPDTITVGGGNHNLRTGDRVIYRDNGLTTITELTDGRVYYVQRESAGRVYLCATLSDAWLREQGASTEITLTPGVSETHRLQVIEGNGCYPIDTVGTTTLTIDTTDYDFPSTSKAAGATSGTTYRVLEAGMYLQYKDKTVQELVGTGVNAAGDLTDLDFTGGNTITIVGGNFDFVDDTGATVQISEGDIIEISGTASNDGRYTVNTRASATSVTVKETVVNENDQNVNATVSVKQGFKRTIGTGSFAFNWKVSGNGAGLQDVFQYVQLELRRETDIDCGPGAFVGTGNTGPVGFIGNINDLLMSFATPTGTGLNMFIDDLNSNDINNATFNDHAGTARNFPFTSAGSLVFNPNLSNDDRAKYWLFFSNDDAPGDNLGRDYGTENAIIVEDATTPTPNAIQGFVNAAGGATHGGTRTVNADGSTSISFTYAYDTNVQRGSGSGGSTAPVTLVAIGQATAQFVIATGSITNATGITISAVAALERNYSGSDPV
jgi:hypothetical protein